jgi:hypothetical protein
VTALKEVRLAELIKSEEPIDRELTSEPVAVQGRTFLPVARLRGKVWRGPAEQPAGGNVSFEAGYVRLTPVRAVVTDVSGQEQTVAITDPTGEALRGIGSAAASIAGLCLALIVGARLWRTVIAIRRSGR